MSERISAFIDNELSELEERRLLAELERDSEMRATWERYHTIRAALRKELEHIAPNGLAAAIAGKLVTEPERGTRKAFTAAVAKGVGGLAIAATVATVAVLNFRSPITPSNESATVASGAATPPAAVIARRESRSSPATHPLQAYLREHSEFATTAGMGNMLPYVRTVRHEDNQ